MTLLQAQAKAQLLADKNGIVYVAVSFASAYKVLSQDWAARLNYEPVSVHSPARPIVTNIVG